MNGDIATFCKSLGPEHVPKETKYFTGKNNITKNIYSIQANDSKMCGNFSFGFVDFMLKGKSLLDYTNLFIATKH